MAPRNATFFYDRLNRGDSDRVQGRRTCRDMAAELRAVLAAAGAAPPYVLVGHSFGAHVALAFADEADDVTGIVLVEPTHPPPVRYVRPFMPLEAISDSGHFIQRDRPDSVVAAVTKLLASLE